jgi:PncC family amidohydrolase
MQFLVPIAAEVATLLKRRGETIAVAESSAGGLISASLLAVPGASAYYLGGAVVYTKQSRIALAGICDDEMRGLRSSSEPYARLLASKIRAAHGATWGLAETGASGPTGNRYGDAAGHSCIALAGPRASSLTIETGDTDREANMRVFAARALAALRDELDRPTG